MPRPPPSAAPFHRERSIASSEERPRESNLFLDKNPEISRNPEGNEPEKVEDMEEGEIPRE
jgi:hypothetical protein